jgi:regulator of protease activity HflC (stomatin/prohibitin superfamily)
MAEIRKYPFARHLRSEPSMETLHYRRGRLARSGQGLSFWFRPLVSAVAELPLDDRDLDFRFEGRSADFQSVAVQGVISFRIADPQLLARRIDFAIDLDSGRWLRAPIERLQSMLNQHAQQDVGDYLSRTELRTHLNEGVDETRERIDTALNAEPQLVELGIAIVAVRVSALRPTAETEKALEMPTRELIQQQADEATFRRRAEAVENERAIQENELKNRIELARREQELVEREGANRRREAEDEGERNRISARAEADRIALVETAATAAERDRAELYAGLSPVATLALVARDTAGRLPQIGQLVITPNLLASLAGRLAGGRGNGN